MARRVFIGWSGEDNQEIAKKIRESLAERNYTAIVGGQWQRAFTVSEEILRQMNGCDFGIMLISKEIRYGKDQQPVSMGMNPNVMMELGYMLHKVGDPNRIRRVLVDMESSELPSDLQGVWTFSVKIDAYDKEDALARDAALQKVADAVVSDFADYMEHTFGDVDKLDYFDNWEEHVQEIYHYTGDVRIADKLIYGMEAVSCSGDYERLCRKLSTIKNRLQEQDRFGDYSMVSCAIAMLNVFVVTERLRLFLSDEQFEDLCEKLEVPYEDRVTDRDLKAWVRILRLDKLELCYEWYGYGKPVGSKSRIRYLYKALKMCHDLVQMIHEQVECKPKDAHYSLLYLSFAKRNISQIHKSLATDEPEKAQEHLQEQERYCAETLADREALYNYYRGSSRENTLMMDYITQEYVRSLAEQHCFADEDEQERIARKVRQIHKKLKNQNDNRNMILQKVEKEAVTFLKAEEA